MRRRTTPPSDLHLAIAVYWLACYNRSRQHSIRINHVFRPRRYSVTTSCNGRPGHKLAALVSTPSKQNTATAQAAQTRTRMQRSSIQGHPRGLSGCRVARDGQSGSLRRSRGCHCPCPQLHRIARCHVHVLGPGVSVVRFGLQSRPCDTASVPLTVGRRWVRNRV